MKAENASGAIGMGSEPSARIRSTTAGSRKTVTNAFFGASIKGSLEVDQNGDLMNANFPTYSPSEGDKAQLKAERGQDGVLKVTMLGEGRFGLAVWQPAAFAVVHFA